MSHLFVFPLLCTIVDSFHRLFTAGTKYILICAPYYVLQSFFHIFCFIIYEIQMAYSQLRYPLREGGVGNEVRTYYPVDPLGRIFFR